MKQHKDYATIIQERGDILFDHECPKCGWNAISEKGVNGGYCEVENDQSGHGMRIKCTCPVCNTEFNYLDNSP